MARMVAERADVIPKLGEVFREYGFDGASLSIMTNRTGLGKGSLYHFFPGGKEEMAEAVLKDIAGWFETNVFLPLENDEPAVGINRMLSTVSDYFRSGQRVCLIGAFALDDSRDRFPGMIRSYFLRWHDCLGNALSRAGMEQCDASHRATEVIAGIQGAIVLTRALNDKAIFLATIERLRVLCADV